MNASSRSVIELFFLYEYSRVQLVQQYSSRY